MPPDDPAPQLPQNPTPSNYQRTTGGDLRWKPPSVEQLAQMLPGYEVISMLGAGGMGAVYKARQISLDRLVAIKVLPPEAAGNEDARFVERFKNEARTMAKMNHPGIVNVYDFGETSEGQLYFVMEFIDGTDVAKMISSQGRLPPEHALAITAHVCDALAYAHRHGVVHRDIKPANILINMEGQVKVADFGLARMEDPSRTSGLTKTGMAMGTPDFVAPEALIMGVNVDGRADLYAVGVMLYQMLTGTIPRGMWTMPSVNLGTDPRFDAIIARAMQTDREQRYQQAAEIRRDLDVILTMPIVQAGGQSSAAIPQQQLPQKPVAKGPQKPMGKSAQVPVRGGATVRGKNDGASAAADQPSSGTSAKKSLPLGPMLAIAATVIIGAGLWFMFSGSGKKPPAGGDAPAASQTTVSSKPVAASDAPSAPPLPKKAVKQTLDLLALTDPNKDRIAVAGIIGANEWLREGQALVFKPDGKSGKLAAPVALSSPDYEIEFRAERRSGRDRIHLDLPLGGGRILPLVLNSPGRKILHEKEGGAWGPMESLVHLTIRVVDGRGPLDRIVIGHTERTDAPLVDWTGDLQRIAKSGEPHPEFPAAAVPSLFVMRDPYAVQKWELRVFEGEATQLRGAAAPALTAGKPADKPADLPPPTEFLAFNGHRYLLLTESLDAKGAAKRAQDLGGHLVTITSQEEQDFLTRSYGARLAKGTQVWLGGIIHPGAGSFSHWETGEAAAFQHWVNGLTGTSNAAREMRLFATAPDFRWRFGHSRFYASIVEWDGDAIPPLKSPEPSAILGWRKELPQLTAEVVKKGGKDAAADGSVAIPNGAYPLTTEAVTDVAVRGRYRGRFDLMLRGDAKSGIRLRFGPDKLVLHQVAKDGSLSGDERRFPFADAQEHRFVAAVAGTALRVWLDDRLLGEAALPSAETGQVHVVCYGPEVTLHELESALIPGNFTALALAPSATPAPAAATASPPPGPLSFRGHRYQYFPEPTQGADARKRALALGGHLASINSKGEQEFLAQSIGAKLAAGTRVWINGVRDRADNTWRWHNGDLFEYTNWAPGKPDGQANALVMIAPEFLWDDDQSIMCPFLVEWDDSAAPVAAAQPSVEMAPPDDPRVAQLESGFQAAFKRDALAPYEKAIAALNQSYLGALGRMRASAQAQGNLDLVTALDGEKTRIESGQGLPPADVGGTPDALVTLRQTYRATAARYAADRDKAATPLYDKYKSALDLYVNELTRANAIDKASAIQAFRASIAARRPKIEAPAAAPAATPKATGTPKAATLEPASAAARSSSWGEAARWIISVGGTLRAGRDGRQFSITSEKEIPAGRFEIMGIDIKANPKSAGITDDDFTRLAPLKELQSIRLDGIPAGDAAFAFARTTPALGYFTVTSNDKVTDAVVDHLAKLENITVLQFQRCPRVTGAGFAKLASLPKLVNVWMDRSGLTDAGLKELRGASAMTQLVADGTAITDAGLEILPSLISLQSLGISPCPGVTGSAFVHLPKLKSFSRFQWGSAKTVAPEALSSLGACPALLDLIFDSLPIEDSHLAALAPLKNVTRLGLTRTKVTGTGIAALSGMKELKFLNLGYETPVTGEGLRTIAAAVPWVDDLLVGAGALLTAEDFRTFAAFKSLRFLQLDACAALTDEALGAMELSVTLERLDMGHNSFTAAGLSRFKVPPKLSRLSLSGCKGIDDTAVPHLKRMTSLTELSVRNSGLSDAGVAELKGALPKCAVSR